MTTSSSHPEYTEKVAHDAFLIYLDRIEKNIPGSPESDWNQAEDRLRERAEKARSKCPFASMSLGLAPMATLNQIKGIGPSFVAKLNAAGIHDVKQLATLQPDDIAQLESKLKCKGRIAREKWVEQARSLIAH